MTRFEYHLTVSFDVTDNKLLYTCKSWYRKGVVDKITII